MNTFGKKYGQVFLSDKNIAAKEIRELDIQEGEKILEIGPGHGILTETLLKNNIFLTAVEPDHRFFDELSERYSKNILDGKFKIVKDSFLNIENDHYDKIIGNIPYNLSSKIIFKILDFDFDMAVIMVQKEFAKRLVAKPGSKDYSRLTVNANVRSDVRLSFTVSRRSFFPPPDVDSAVVAIVKKKYDIDIIEFDKFLIDMFSKRRKKISTIIKNYSGPLKDKRPYELNIKELTEIFYCHYRRHSPF